MGSELAIAGIYALIFMILYAYCYYSNPKKDSKMCIFET